MLQQSWVLFEGIGDVMEAKLWERGLLDWTDDASFEQACELAPALRKQHELREVALRALNERNAKAIAMVLPKHEHWRLWNEFGEEAVYLDIETTGLGGWAHITVLGTLHKGKYRGFVHGTDLAQAWDFLKAAPLIITFNGRQFDVPFIERHFGAELNVPHIDLRFVAASLGYKGGLKKIEPEFGIERTGEIKAVNGYEAVLLWKKFARGDRLALQKLIDYNQADVEGLPIIMKGCWERKREWNSNSSN